MHVNAETAPSFLNMSAVFIITDTTCALKGKPLVFIINGSHPVKETHLCSSREAICVHYYGKPPVFNIKGNHLCLVLWEPRLQVTDGNRLVFYRFNSHLPI